MSRRLAGQIVTVSFESGDDNYECGLEGCECPDHDGAPPTAGMYVTVRLDREARLGLTRAEVVVPDVVEAQR